MNNDNGQISFGVTLDDSELKRQINAAVSQFGRMGDVAEEEGGRMDATFSKIGKALSGIAAGWSVKEFASKVANVRGEFQQLEIAFETMLGSGTKANDLMSQLIHTAAITPFDLQGVANGAKQLLAYGTAADEVNETLTRLGDIASGLSIPLGDMVYLYGTTMTQGRLYTQDLRQFMGRGIPLAEELAAQFGVAKDKVGELVTAGKVGAEEVKKAIWNMTNEGSKFGGLMEKQSASITGQISNLEDAVDTMFNEIGKASQGAITTAISGVSYLVENYKEVGAILASIATAYGTYKAAIVAVAVAQRVNIALLRQAVVEKRLAAAASITLSNAEAIAAAKSKMFALAQKQVIATLKGAAAIMTNPYILLATVVGAAAYGIHKLATRESEAERALKKYNETKEETIEKEREHKSKVDELLNSLTDVALAELDRTKNLAELRNEYPKIFEQYDIESIKLADILQLKRQIAEEDARRSQSKEDADLEAAEKAVLDYRSKIQTNKWNRGYLLSSEKKHLAALEAVRDQYLKDRALSVSESFRGSLSGLKAGDLDRYVSELEKRISGKGNSASILMKLPVDAQGTLSKEAIFSVQQIKDLISATQSAKDNIGNVTTYKQDYENARKEWNEARTALAEIEADKDKYTSKQYTDAVERAETAKKTYKDLGGVVETEKVQNGRLKKQEELNEMLKDLELKNQQEDIALQKEGTKKQLDQIQQSYKERENEIKKLETDFARKNKEAGVGGLNVSGLTTGQQSAINQAKVLNTKTMSKAIADLYKEPLSRYQDYTDKRLAIEKKYNEDLALLEEARKQAQESGNAEDLAKIERSIAKAKTEKSKELLENDFDILKESPEYVRAFEDLKNTSSETLNYLVGELERLKGTAAASLNPKDLKEYTDAIQSIMDELDSRDPFKALIDRQKELAAANKKLAEAKRNLDAVNSGKSVNKTKENEDGTEEATDVYLTAAEALEKYNEAKDEADKASNKYGKAEKAVLDEVNTLTTAIGTLGDTIGGQAGEILNLISTVATCVTTSIEGISSVSKKGASAMSVVEKASVILGIISSVVQALKAISSLGDNKQYKEYEKYAAKLDEINALTDAVSDYRIAVLEAQQAENSWFSEDSLQNLRDYKEIQTAAYEAYAKKALESQAIYQNKSGGGRLTGAVNWIMSNLSAAGWWNEWREIWGQGEYAEGQTAAINNLRIETRKKSSGFLGSGIGAKSQKTQDLQSWIKDHADEFSGLSTDLFDEDGFINTELAQAILDNYEGKLVGQTKETLEELIELKEKYDEYIEQLHEYVSSLYEPLVDNFVDSLWDWFDEGKDALTSFKEYAGDTFRDIVSDMMKTIVLEKVVGSFSDDIAEIYEEYARGSVDEETLMQKVAKRTGELIDSYEEQTPTLQKILTQVNDYLSDAGIDMHDTESTSQDSSSKGFSTASQDTVNELNGRFTAVQIDTNAIRTILTEMSANASLNSVNISAIKEHTSEMRNLALLGIDHLEAISKNTHELYEMNERLGQIEKNTRQI